jgi:hypothetical protein
MSVGGALEIPVRINPEEPFVDRSNPRAARMQVLSAQVTVGHLIENYRLPRVRLGFL